MYVVPEHVEVHRRLIDKEEADECVLPADEVGARS